VEHESEVFLRAVELSAGIVVTSVYVRMCLRIAALTLGRVQDESNNMYVNLLESLTPGEMVGQVLLSCPIAR